MSEQLEVPQATTRNLIKDLPQVRTPNFVDVYTNNTSLAANFYDVTTIFGKVVVNADGKAVVENSVAVTMSWEHARALAAGLNAAIETYEKDQKATIRKNA